jgi:aspartate racemase
MKTIGLIGGTGWISTAEYYRIINEETNRRRGGLNFAKCILYSLDYGEIDEFNKRNDRESVYSLIYNSSKKIISSGAECLLICANTLHQFADDLEKEFDIPLIHIAKVTATEIQKQGFCKVGLLGTKQTMEMDFYRKSLEKRNIEVIVPDQNDRDYIQNAISNEILKGKFLEGTKERFRGIIQKLGYEGAMGIVLGCTEIPLLINQDDSSLPLFDTLTIHALAAVDFALSDSAE